MKIKIDYYLVKIAKENLIYFVFFIFLIAIYFIFGYIFFDKTKTNVDKINSTTVEIADLKRKSELVKYKQEIIKEGIDLAETNKLLTKLIPNEEDYFSLIAALEEISRKTNFLIVNYSINLQSSSIGKLSLTIEGKGDEQTFFNFLKDYRYVGERLITIDKIDYRTSGFTQAKLNVNFYSGKVAGGGAMANLKLNEEEKELIKSIKDKISLTIKPEEEASPSSYSIKSNPF